MKELETRYLERLSDLYPTIAAASTEIINLQAILNLPKGTEHFLTDIHGEWEAFSHVLKNGSGAVRSKIEDVFGYTLGKREKQELATLIYYPKEKTEQVKRTEKHMEEGIMKKVASFCNVDLDCVIQSEDLPSIYEVPVNMQNQPTSRMQCLQ